MEYLGKKGAQRETHPRYHRRETQWRYLHPGTMRGRLEASTVLCGGAYQFGVVSVSLVSSVVSVASVKSFLDVPKVRTKVGRYTNISRSCFLPQHRKNATCLQVFFFALRVSTRRSRPWADVRSSRYFQRWRPTTIRSMRISK